MIDVEKHNRNVTLLCPTCGQNQFEYEPEGLDDNSPMKCIHCQLILTKAQLIEANRENVSAHVKEMSEAIISDLQKDLTRAFSGNKYIKIK